MGGENVLQLVVVMFVHSCEHAMFSLGDFPRGAVESSCQCRGHEFDGEDSTCHGAAKLLHHNY